ncbi:MAG: sigma-54-dependent Fis family transcriptional regulator [Deltaproteobacteria bacterium]|nr:MAG: sigma-54-dependent Fis family transcriptional regulator [Deltaproteobacteria bacterium]
MDKRGYLLISWLARKNDPFSQQRDGRRLPGPTLTLLFDEASPYRGKIERALFFCHRTREEQDREIAEKLVEATKRAILERGFEPARLEFLYWDHENPTDHRAIFEFLKERLKEIGRKYPEFPLLVHINPGTPAMQTIWVLLGSTGMLEGTLVRTLRPHERSGRQAAEEVKLEIPSLLRVLRHSRPRAEEEGTRGTRNFWNPERFRSEKLQRLYEDARRFAPLNVPILILGERGVGKTRLASWIRLNSPYRQVGKDRSWPSVSCGQYTPELMRGELFGYRKGAFTDARKDYDGLLKEADGDTLFLDEIGDISIEVQRLLIRAIEEKEYLPIGGQATVRSNFRLITATNRTREELQERLCPDFFDRIAYFVLKIPALREIPEEIPWLWEEIFHDAVRQNEMSSSISPLPAALHERIASRLQEMILPGNLRDLYQLAYHLLAFLAGDSRDAEDAVADAFDRFEKSQRWEGGGRKGLADLAKRQAQEVLAEVLASSETSFKMKEYLDRFTEFLIEEAVTEKKGNQSAAAKLLGTSPQNLHARRKRRSSVD